LYLAALKRWFSSTSGHVAVFDRHGSTVVRNVDIVMSHLAFPKATVCYYAVKYVGAKAIIAVILEAA
jgi:hypothetical protein